MHMYYSYSTCMGIIWSSFGQYLDIIRVSFGHHLWTMYGLLKDNQGSLGNHLGFMFEEIKGGEAQGRSPPAKQGRLGGRRPPNHEKTCDSKNNSRSTLEKLDAKFD